MTTPRVSTMTPDERAAYDQWVTANPNRYGSALMNAFLDGRRSVKPNWEALSTAAKLAHLETCWSCEVCADGRAWGVCSSCGRDPVEALPPFAESRCCGSPVALGSEVAS